MLKMESTQIEAIKVERSKLFEIELVERIGEFAPDRERHFDKPRRELIAGEALVGAREHGFTRRGPIRLWLQLTLSLGTRFWENPLFGHMTFACEVGQHQLTRADEIFDWFRDYAEATKRNDFVQSVIRLDRALTFLRSDEGSRNAGADLKPMLEQFFPDACAYFGSIGTLDPFIESQSRFAEMDAVETCGMMCTAFALGYRFDVDPGLPPLFADGAAGVSGPTVSGLHPFDWSASYLEAVSG